MAGSPRERGASRRALRTASSGRDRAPAAEGRLVFPAPARAVVGERVGDAERGHARAGSANVAMVDLQLPAALRLPGQLRHKLPDAMRPGEIQRVDPSRNVRRYSTRVALFLSEHMSESRRATYGPRQRRTSDQSPGSPTRIRM